MPETALSHRLTTIDASFIYSERPNQAQHVGGCFIYEGQLTRAELLAAVEARLHRLPRFRQRLVFPPFGVAHPSWEDDPDFDLGAHIREADLPTPGDDQVLSRVSGEVFAPPLDRARPLWRMTLLHGLASGNTAMIWNQHHAMVDGLSVVKLALALHDISRKAEPEEAQPPWQPLPIPDPFTLYQRALQDQLAATAASWRRQATAANQLTASSETARRLGAAASDAVAPAFQPTRPMPFNGTLSERRQLAWAEFPFAAVREVKSVLGGTVNDVVLALIAGGIGRYLRQHGHSYAGLELRTLVPVSMRQPEEEEDLGNRITSLIVPLYVDIANPVERLAAERRAMEELKRSDQAARLYALSQLADRIPPLWQALAGQWQSGSGASFIHTVCSNVPGPQIPLYLRGRKLVAMRLFGALAGTSGLFNAIYSYNQLLTICILVDPTLMPDPWLYVDCLKESFQELRNASVAAQGNDATPARASSGA